LDTVQLPFFSEPLAVNHLFWCVANGFGYQAGMMNTRKVKKQTLTASFIFLTQQHFGINFISVFFHSTTK